MDRISSSEAFVETLVAQGVTDVFGIVGSAYMDALDLFQPAGIRFISVAHEQDAAHMADGYSRVSGRHGVCIAQNGPGVTNFVTGIAAAYWAHSPVVAITPECGSAGTGLGGFQETDQMPIFSKITKFQVHVNRPDRIAELTSHAFDIALAEHGPVQVNIPRDYFYAEFAAQVPAPRRFAGPAGAPQSLDDAADLLAAAQFPVIVAGGGVVVAKADEALVQLAELLSAPVVTSYLHNDAFPASHHLSMGPLGYQGSKAAMAVIAQADVVLALGSRLGPFGTLPQYGIDYWPAGARVIQVDTDQRAIGLVKQVAVGIQADARLAAEALYERLQKRALSALATRDRRLQEVARQKEAWRTELAGQSEAEGSPISPRRALAELQRALPAGSMVSTDIGNICSVANSYLHFEQSPSFLAPMSFGNCGYAFPAAIGAKVARPDRPAIAYVGDGAWGMSLAEVLTCVREEIPVVAVVFNNGQWGAEKKNQIDYYDSRFPGTDLKNPSFAGIARSMGADGTTVSGPGEVGDALRAATASGRPAVLEIMVNQELGEPFRRDALRKPTRLLAKYASYTVR
jgi:sulfoacetaldehyde acetyltransferase